MSTSFNISNTGENKSVGGQVFLLPSNKENTSFSTKELSLRENLTKTFADLQLSLSSMFSRGINSFSRGITNLRHPSTANYFKNIARISFIAAIVLSVILPAVVAALLITLISFSLLAACCGGIVSFLVEGAFCLSAMAFVLGLAAVVKLFPVGLLAAVIAVACYVVGKLLETPQEKIVAVEKEQAKNMGKMDSQIEMNQVQISETRLPTEPK